EEPGVATFRIDAGRHEARGGEGVVRPQEVRAEAAERGKVAFGRAAYRDVRPAGHRPSVTNASPRASVEPPRRSAAKLACRARRPRPPRGIWTTSATSASSPTSTTASPPSPT